MSTPDAPRTVQISATRYAALVAAAQRFGFRVGRGWRSELGKFIALCVSFALANAARFERHVARQASDEKQGKE